LQERGEKKGKEKQQNIGEPGGVWEMVKNQKVKPARNRTGGDRGTTHTRGGEYWKEKIRERTEKGRGAPGVDLWGGR